MASNSDPTAEPGMNGTQPPLVCVVPATVASRYLGLPAEQKRLFLAGVTPQLAEILIMLLGEPFRALLERMGAATPDQVRD